LCGSIGGQVLDDTLKGPTFANADFWFPEFNVVAELKCLTENFQTSETVKARLTRLHTSWVQRGLVPYVGAKRLQLNLRELPIICAKELLEVLNKKREPSALKHANRQIRETKSHLGVPTAQGLLILVNDGNHMLPPGVVAHLLARVAKTQLSSIDSVIYFSANEVVSAPGIGSEVLFWVDGLLPGREPVAPKLRRKLKEAWFARHSSLLPEPISEIAMADPHTVFDGLQFR
jgi:hypothetical protein